MKYSIIFEDALDCSNSSEVFDCLMNSLKNCIRTWDYFVNWQKVFKNISSVEIDLNTLNYLVGKENIEEEFVRLLREHPTIAALIPGLIAIRDADLTVLIEYSSKEFKYMRYDFSRKIKLEEDEIEKIVLFAKNVGFLELLRNRQIKSIPDYFIGVEVGLDSNGRKNRGGTLMEKIVEASISEICARNDFSYLPQATASKVMSKFGINLSVDKSSRAVDFAINTGERLYLIETNFYGGAYSGEHEHSFRFIVNT